MRKKLEICNEKVLEEATARTGESQKMVSMVIDFAASFIAARIREGSLESVRIPRFGLFRAKLETVQYKAKRAAAPKYTQRIAGGPLTGTGVLREEEIEDDDLQTEEQ